LLSELDFAEGDFPKMAKALSGAKSDARQLVRLVEGNYVI
jgi:hypothetical protein